MWQNSSSSEYESLGNYEKNGFVIVRSVLSRPEVKELREFIFEKFKLYKNQRRLILGDTLLYPEIYRIQFRGKIVESLKSLIGSGLCYMPELHVQVNMFGFPGWHTDSAGEMPAEYLLDDGYKFAKCGIYLQDNTQEWGGGIMVQPRGHKFPLRTKINKLDFFLKRLSNRVWRNSCKITVDTQAGDMVIFDSRLPHASTAPGNMEGLSTGPSDTIEGISKEFSKYVIYWNSADIQMSTDYLNFGGPERTIMAAKATGDLFLANSRSFHFPEDYPDEYVNLATKHSIKIGCLSQEKCAEYKNLIQQSLT